MNNNKNIDEKFSEKLIQQLGIENAAWAMEAYKFLKTIFGVYMMEDSINKSKLHPQVQQAFLSTLFAYFSGIWDFYWILFESGQDMKVIDDLLIKVLLKGDEEINGH